MFCTGFIVNVTCNNKRLAFSPYEMSIICVYYKSRQIAIWIFCNCQTLIDLYRRRLFLCRFNAEECFVGCSFCVNINIVINNYNLNRCRIIQQNRTTTNIDAVRELCSSKTNLVWCCRTGGSRDYFGLKLLQRNVLLRSSSFFSIGLYFGKLTNR